VSLLNVLLARTLKGAALGTAAALAFGVLALRASRSGIAIEESGIVARADRFTRRLRWEEVELFAVRRRRTGGVWAKKRSGRWVKLMDVGAPARAKGIEFAEHLEVERQRHGGR
jgi:hypothetical protein